jgi:hypothetical protein
MMCFVEFTANFLSTGCHNICEELGLLCDDINSSYLLLQNNQADIIKELIRQGIQARMIYDDLNDEIVYHYILMGLRYFQTDPEYRNKMEHDSNFKKRFLRLIWRNIFTDSTCYEFAGGDQNETRS